MQQPFLTGLNDREVCPHIGKGHHSDCLNRSCQASESMEVGDAYNFVDRTYEAICTFFQDLLLRKQGAAFEKLTMQVAGHSAAIYPEVLSVEGQRQQLSGNSNRRTFVYEAKQVNGIPVISFEKQLVQETTPKSIARLGSGFFSESSSRRN